MEPTIQADAGPPARSRPRALIAAAVLGATILLGGAASVFAASPSARPSGSQRQRRDWDRLVQRRDGPRLRPQRQGVERQRLLVQLTGDETLYWASGEVSTLARSSRTTAANARRRDRFSEALLHFNGARHRLGAALSPA